MCVCPILGTIWVHGWGNLSLRLIAAVPRGTVLRTGRGREKWPPFSTSFPVGLEHVTTTVCVRVICIPSSCMFADAPLCGPTEERPVGLNRFQFDF